MAQNKTGRIILLVTASGLALAVTAAAGACSSDKPAAGSGSSGTSGSSGSSGTSGASGTSGGVDAAADQTAPNSCPALALGGQVVNAKYLGGTTPDDKGGTLRPGTYDLTGLEVYLGTPEQGDPDSGPVGGTDSAQATLVVTADTVHWARVSKTAGISAPLEVTKAKVRTESYELVQDGICPTTDSSQVPFTAVGNTLTLHSAQTRREIYTRRP